MIKIFLSSGDPLPLGSAEANTLPHGSGPVTLANRCLYSFGHRVWFRESSYADGAIRGLARSLTLEVLNEKACILFLPAVHSCTSGANSHSDQFCHGKERACLEMKLAQGWVGERSGGRETGIPKYWTNLIFSSPRKYIPSCALFTLTWVPVTGNPKNPC